MDLEIMGPYACQEAKWFLLGIFSLYIGPLIVPMRAFSLKANLAENLTISFQKDSIFF